MYESVLQNQPASGYKSVLGSSQPTEGYQSVLSESPKPAIQPPSYFTGGGYSVSQSTDPYSGKPLLKAPLTIPETYQTPEMKISQISPERVATTFDPTKAQKLTPDMLKNQRLPESASQSIRKHLGDNFAELDHIMPLELGGSNTMENLRGGGVDTAKENEITQKALKGEISVADAWLEMADYKGVKLPESKPGLIEKIRNEVLKSRMLMGGGTLQTLADLQEDPLSLAVLQENPLSLGKSLSDILSTPYTDAKKASEDTQKAAVAFAEGLKNKASVSEDVANALNFLSTWASGSLTPITTWFNTANKIPIVGSVSRLLFNLPFSVIGDLTGEAGVGYLRILNTAGIISDEDFDKLEPAVRNVTGLAGQIVLGGKLLDEAGRSKFTTAGKVLNGAKDALKTEGAPKEAIDAVDRVPTKTAEKLNKQHGLEDAKTIVKEAAKTAVQPKTEATKGVSEMPKSAIDEFAERTKPKEPTSITLTSGFDPGLDKFIAEDVKPGLQGAGEGLVKFLKEVVNVFSPKTGVAKNVLDRVFEMKGARDKAESILDLTTQKIEKSFDKLSQNEQVAFIDKIKRGERQATPELQAVADFMRQIEDETYKEVQKYKPSAVWKEDHFRVLWKKVPGMEEARGFRGLFRRPLEGTKGFLKHSTLIDMSEGLAKGGEPHSYNPMTMFKNSYADMMHFITAQKMWDSFKNMKVARFLKGGKPMPEGFTELNDRLANVYFPTKAGMVRAGRWVVEENAGRILNNYLSRDAIRATALGRGLMAIKNSTTAVELTLSAFHFTFETIETASSGMGVGIRKFVNLGLLKLNPKMMVEGIKDIILSPTTPKTTFSAGREFLASIKDGKDFRNSKAGQRFLKNMPDSDKFIDDFFNGGGKLKMPKDYEINMQKAFMQNLASGNYIGATLRAAPAAIKMMMKPLFDYYIPALKIGMFVKEFPLRLEERAGQLARGTETRAELARQTIDFIDYRLGEMNFDNLFWNRTFKTGLQFLFRSVTWKLGNVEAFLKEAIYRQSKEVVDAFREGRIPQISPGMAWAISLAIYTATISTIVTKATTGKYPWELPGAIKNLIYPRIDINDETKRISLPTYARDAYSLVHAPLGYVKSSMSGEIGRMFDVWQNRDFYGTEIYGSTDPFAMRALYGGLHLVPLPFSISNLAQPQMPTYQKVGGFLGFTKAPGYISKTNLQLDIDNLYQERFGGGVQTKEQTEASRAKMAIRQAYIEGDSEKANQLLKEAVAKGYIKEKGIDRFIKDSDIPGDVRAFSRFDAADQAQLVGEMTVDDLRRYAWKLKPEVKAGLSIISDDARQFVNMVNSGEIKEPKWVKGKMTQ